MKKVNIDKELRIKLYGDMVRKQYPVIFDNVSNYELLQITQFFRKQNPPKKAKQ